MNRLQFYIQRTVDETTDEPLPFTVIQIQAPTNQRITILGCDICMQHDDPATTPSQFRWETQDALITAPATIGTDVGTVQKADRGYDETIQGTFYSNKTDGTSSEGGIGTRVVLIELSIHEQGYAFWRPPFPIVIKGNEIVGLRYMANATRRTASITVYCEQ